MATFSKILTLVFKYAVMAFSASMTVYSLYSAFDGGVLGWVFGIAGIAVFEAAAMYWQVASKVGREGQIVVALVAQWSTMTLSLLSTLVGIALLTEWGASLRSALPLGIIMIVLIGLGLAVNMFAFLAYEDEEPEAKRTHQARMIQAARAAMVYEGDMRALSAARSAMEEKIAVEAPTLGAQLADDGMISVREHSAPRLQAPRSTSPWPVVVPNSPTMAFGGGDSSPRHANGPAAAQGMNYRKPAESEKMEPWEEDTEAPKVTPRQPGSKNHHAPTASEVSHSQTPPPWLNRTV